MYGISIPQHCAECIDFIKRIDTRYLNCVELQGDLIFDRKILEVVKAKKLHLVNSYDCIKNSTIINSLDQPEVFQDELISGFDSILSGALYISLRGLTVDFALSKYIDSEKLLNFLKKLYYGILQSGKIIYIPVVIPGMENKIEQIQKALYKLMLNRFKICLNIYPHDIVKHEDFAQFIEDLSLRIELVRICYDAYSGNYISEKLFNLWKEILKKSDLNCPLIFVPSVKSVELIENETIKLYELLNVLPNMQ